VQNRRSGETRLHLYVNDILRISFTPRLYLCSWIIRGLTTVLLRRNLSHIEAGGDLAHSKLLRDNLMARAVVLRTLYGGGDASTVWRLLAVLLCAQALSGCAAGTAAPARPSALTSGDAASFVPLAQASRRRGSAYRVPGPNKARRSPANSCDGPSHRALLQGPPKPACEFHEIGLGDTVPDATESARLKLDYERRCYRQAEMLVRVRLQRLQACRVQLLPWRRRRPT
jgi:hypothetical protein